MFFCPSSIEFVSVCLLCLCIFSRISSRGKASPCCLPFPLFFPHFSSLYIYIFQLFRWALPMFLYCHRFSSFVFLPVLIHCVFHLFEDQFKVEKRWRKGGERLPVVSLFLRLTLFLTPAASQHLPTLEKQKTFEKYFFDRATLCLSIICALKYPSI